MTHDELLKKILKTGVLGRELGKNEWIYDNKTNALRAVVKLAGKDIEHESYVWLDGYDYAMKQVIQAIEKELR